MFSPPINYSMRKLDRNFFKKKIQLLAGFFQEKKNVKEFLNICKEDILSVKSVSKTVKNNGRIGVLFKESINDCTSFEKNSSSITKQKVLEFNITLEPYYLNLTYEFWKTNEILRAIFSQNELKTIPSGFTKVGHVAHINLTEEYKPYGELIAQVIIDKNKIIKTVVDKKDTIKTQFRTFDMKILAGINDLNVVENELGCVFKFNFEKVYWNSRLSLEHKRLVDSFNPGDSICDVFAGVGPFTIPAAKKKVTVISNDLNPYSVKYLNENITCNKVDNYVKTFNLDGSDFIKASPKILIDFCLKEKKITEVISKNKKREPNIKVTSNPLFFKHYVMNLPDSSISFLNNFIGLYSNDTYVENIIKNAKDFELPYINIYSFEKFSPEFEEPTIEELQKRIRKKIIEALNFNIPIDDFEFHYVRKVSPSKIMFCSKFKLPKKVAFNM